MGVWGITGTYGAFTPLMYLPLRIFRYGSHYSLLFLPSLSLSFPRFSSPQMLTLPGSQQNQDSPFELGVVTVVAGHSGPETAADARSHFGIFAPQVKQFDTASVQTIIYNRSGLSSRKVRY